VPDRLATFDFQTCSRQPRSETAWLPASWRNFASQFKPRSQKWQLHDQSQQWPNTVQQLFLLNQHRLRQSIQLSRHHPAETVRAIMCALSLSTLIGLRFILYQPTEHKDMSKSSLSSPPSKRNCSLCVLNPCKLPK
jgi:hypothetical protein